MKAIRAKVVTLIPAFCLFMIGFAGCAKQQTTAAPDIPETVSYANAERTEKLNNQLFASASIASDPSDYLLGPGDLLEVKVLEAEKLDATVRVSSRGEVSLPLLGEVYVKGKTASEAEALIEDMYRESYIRNPHVTIFLVEHHSQRITLVGQVKNPGTYDYPSKQRLLDAIALAGGLNEQAGYTVYVRRPGESPEDEHQSLLVDLDQLINQGNENLNVLIHGGDTIFVTEAGSYYVDGAVRKPGQYFIKHALTIKQALLAAGGLAPYANPEKLILVRKTDEGMKEILINVEEDRHTLETMNMAEDDILYVGASFWGKLIHGGGLRIGLPFFGVDYRDPHR
jgi:polysaccharide export outer membrane protein